MHANEVLSWGQRVNGLHGPSRLIKWGWGISTQRAWLPEMAQSAGESPKAERKLSRVTSLSSLIFSEGN